MENQNVPNETIEEAMDRMWVNIHPMFIGGELANCPFANLCASQRLTMVSNHFKQFVHVEEPEYPRIFSGLESEWNKRTLSLSERDSDVIVHAVLPIQRPLNSGLSNPNNYLCIATSVDTGDIVVFEISKYAQCGLKYTPTYETRIPSVGSYVGKDDELMVSSMTPYGKAIGVNANVAYIAMAENVDDAVIISESLAKRMAYQELKTYTIKIKPEDLLINLHGDANNFKVMLDVGEKVTGLGRLIAKRPASHVLDISDIMDENINKITMFDTVYTTEPCSREIDSEIVAIDVNVPLSVYKKCQNEMFSQINAYYDVKINRYKTIISTMENLMSRGHDLSNHANTILTEAYIRVAEHSGDRRSKFKLMERKDMLQAYSVKITVKTKYALHEGNKLTGRQGEKGVVSAVWPTENMPVNKHGIRADIIQAPAPISNRLNPGQTLEQLIVGCGEFIAINARNGNTPREKMYDYFIEFISDMNPVYGEMVKENTINRQDEFVETVLSDGFYIQIPPFSKINFTYVCSLIENKYGFVESETSYIHPQTGGLITLDYPTIIGGRYTYLMDSTPKKHITASSLGYVNQFGTPVRNKSKQVKYTDTIGRTPQREGEDETSIITMMSGVDALSRLQQLHANSPDGTDMLSSDLLLKDKPTSISRVDIGNEDLIKSNIQANIANHMLGMGGIIHIENEGSDDEHDN